MGTKFIFQIIGAFMTWAFKGFKGKLNDEIALPYEQTWKYYRNSIISLLVVGLLYWMFSK
jgi:hypothetical protein